MHFDDRLATVLRQPAGSEMVARIQYRQLLDLLGTVPSRPRGEATDAAGLRLAELAAEIDAPTRAILLRDQGLRLRNPRLVALLAEVEPAVASAALEAAELDEEQWLDLAPALPVAARGHLRAAPRSWPGCRGIAHPARHFRPRPASGQGCSREADRKAPPGKRGEDTGPNGIGALVRRIDEFRKSRQPLEADFAHADAPRLPLDDLADLPQANTGLRLRFHHRCRIADRLGRSGLWRRWQPGEPVAQPPAGSPVASAPAACGSAGCEIEGASAISGVWQIDASPHFDRKDGHFTGYAGRMRRLTPAGRHRHFPCPIPAEADRMRQLLHELNTPVNADPGLCRSHPAAVVRAVPHGYRALAASIASDAATMLAGFDELDRLARLDTGSLELEQGTCRLCRMCWK